MCHNVTKKMPTVGVELNELVLFFIARKIIHTNFNPSFAKSQFYIQYVSGNVQKCKPGCILRRRV